MIKDSLVAAAVSNLKKELAHARDKEFEKNRDYIESGLKREYISAYLGEGERIAYTLESDAQVLKAIEVLKDMERYKKTLSAK